MSQKLIEKYADNFCGPESLFETPEDRAAYHAAYIESVTRLLAEYDALRDVEGWHKRAANSLVNRESVLFRSLVLGDLSEKLWRDADTRLSAIDGVAALIAQHAPKGVDVEILKKVAGAKDNEATAYPVWYIVDMRQMMSLDIHRFMSMVTGPFFSRESATETMNALRHRFKHPIVYCNTGHLSGEWKELYDAAALLAAQGEK